MTTWAMVIDLRKCVACETCKQVCDDGNRVPPGATWRRLSHIANTADDADSFYTIGCMQCKNAPCVAVCPTHATVQRRDGIVTVDSQRCIGCAACVLACPYMARSIVFEDSVMPLELVFSHNRPRKRLDRSGTCTKCDFCAARLERGLEKGLQPGVDPEATPLCVLYCIGEAMSFGDLDDPRSNVSQLLRDQRTITLNPQAATDPSVYYIPRDGGSTDADC